MDCFERGLIGAEKTNGIELRLGSADALVKLVEAIGQRQGIGHALGEGLQRAARHLGVGKDLVVALKGQELPAHMPQDKRSLGAIYAVNPFGVDHRLHEHGPFYTGRAWNRVDLRLNLRG